MNTEKMDQKKIKEEGLELIEEFSQMLEKIGKTEETHYVLDLKNITREDKKPLKREDFPEKLKKIVPRWEDNYIIAEKGTK